MTEKEEADLRADVTELEAKMETIELRFEQHSHNIIDGGIASATYKPDPAPPEGIAPRRTLEQIAEDGVKSAEKLKGSWICQECGEIADSDIWQCSSLKGDFHWHEDIAHTVKWIPPVEQGKWICQECGKDWGEGWDIGTHWMSKGKTFWCPPSDDYIPGCGKKAVKWIPAVEDTTAPNEGADDPSAMEGVDLGIINDQWVEIDRLKAENAELSDKLHDFEINDFRNTPDKVPESEGITEHAILSRYAPPPKAPESEPRCPYDRKGYCNYPQEIQTRDAEIDRLTADNAELIEAIKKEVDDRDEVYAENELLKAQMETMTKVTYAREVATLTEEMKRYMDAMNTSCGLAISHGMDCPILDALSDK